MDGDTSEATGIRHHARRESGPGNKSELSQTKQRVKIEAQMKVEGVFVGGNDEASRKEGISGSAEPLQRQECARWLLRQTL